MQLAAERVPGRLSSSPAHLGVVMSWPDPAHLRWTPTLRVPSDDGTEIAVEILGDGHPGPSVVFIHGWTFSSRSWHYQRMLAERYRLVLMDHRDQARPAPGPGTNARSRKSDGAWSASSTPPCRTPRASPSATV